MADATREVTKGFPFLSRIESSVARAYVFYCSTLPTSERTLLAVGMAKRFQNRALILKGESPGQEEREVTARCVDWLRCFIATPSMCSNPQPSAQLLEKRGPSPQAVNKKVLRQLLQSKLELVFRDPDKEWYASTSEWRYRTLIKEIYVETYVDIGGRVPLSYHHVLQPSSSSGPELPSLRSSIFGWMGLGTTTDWDLLANERAEDAADLTVEICTHLVSGLSEIAETLRP
jgi:hypothetical protein